MFEEDDHTSFEPSLNIVCLNVHNGGGERWRDIFAFLDTYSPDIVVFTEWRADRPSVIRWASAHGMTFVQANEGASENGVFVAAKSTFSTNSATPDRSCVGTLTLVRFADWSMLACYFPGNDKLGKARYFDTCQRIASDCKNQPFLIVGDLNTGNPTLDRTPRGTPFFCASQFDDLSTGGNLVDLWRRSNGTETQEWTWRSRAKMQNGFRLDHAFGNRKFVESYRPFRRYDHRPRRRASAITALFSSRCRRRGEKASTTAGEVDCIMFCMLVTWPTITTPFHDGLRKPHGRP